MSTRIQIALLIIFVALVIACVHLAYGQEDFANKREKAQAIVRWFDVNREPKYTKYKTDVQGSNIVEYEDARRLHLDGQLQVDSMRKVL